MNNPTETLDKDSIVEKVARATYEAAPHGNVKGGVLKFDELLKFAQDTFRLRAKAAITAHLAALADGKLDMKALSKALVYWDTGINPSITTAIRAYLTALKEGGGNA